MTLDAVIIADSGTDSVSATNPLKLTIDGRTADIQVVQNFLAHAGRIQDPIDGDGIRSWASAFKLNGIYLHSFLTKHNYNVELVNNFHEEKDRFLRLLKSNPRAVIISTTFIVRKQSLCKLVAEIRDLAPDIFIVAGGPLVYMSHLILGRSREPNYDVRSATKDYLFLEINKEPAVDLYVISKCGEEIICHILSNLRNKMRWDDIPNTARLIDGAFQFSKKVADATILEDSAIDWSAVPDIVFESGVVPMQASGGCPYHCAFCNFIKDHQSTWVKQVDQIVAEAKTISARGARYIWFVDDNFRLGSGDLGDVCRQFIDKGLNLRWMTFIRASTLDKIDPKLLRQAGCVEVQLGLESADPRILKNMDKRASPELYYRVLKKLLKAGICCSCYFIFGFPGETEKSAQGTREFIKSFDTDAYDGNLCWSMFPFLLTPLSPIYEYEARKKYELSGYMQKWAHATMNSDQARQEVVKTFFEIENSGPIYRGDNQDIMRRMKPNQRRRFHAARHQLSKMALSGKLANEKLFQVFQQALNTQSGRS